MMRGSNAGHKSANAATTVAMVIALSVALDGRLLVRQLRCHTESHDAATITVAIADADACERPNQARRPPAPAVATAGSANGSTQHTPHATAPVAVASAATEASRTCGGELEEGRLTDILRRFRALHRCRRSDSGRL